jgi:NAD(P)-dependent dehydrogenase (short-subunit alcohol dehydrogenase family)
VSPEIGPACAVRLGREGFEAVAAVRTPEEAEDVYAAAELADVAIETELVEITDTAACEDVIERRRPFALVTGSEVDAAALLGLARLSAPQMRARGAGRIVVVSSAERRGSGDAFEALRLELASDGIDVSRIEPGRTGASAEAVAGLVVRAISSRSPRARYRERLHMRAFAR